LGLTEKKKGPPGTLRFCFLSMDVRALHGQFFKQLEGGVGAAGGSAAPKAGFRGNNPPFYRYGRTGG